MESTVGLDPASRSALGQFLSGADISAFLASMFETRQGPIRLLDPGAGVGSLAVAVVDRFHRAGAGPVAVTAVEVDEKLLVALKATLDDAAETTGGSYEVIGADFTEWGVDRAAGFGAISAEPFDLVVMNPPYRKIGSNSHERRRLADLGVDVSNLYAAFIAVAIRLLKPGGELVAITPRSFVNGPYFRPFRTDFLQMMSLRRIHLYEARDSAFGEDEVLQENIILHAVRSQERVPVVVTTSSGVEDRLPSVREVPYEQVVRPDDLAQFIHLPVDEAGAAIAARLRSLQGSLQSLGCAVSTGRVVDFRTRHNLRPQPEPGTVPLVYPTHFAEGRVRWPAATGRKPNALVFNDSTASLVLPNGCYVLVKRFSSKEERRRVVAVVSDPEQVPGPLIAFENHLTKAWTTGSLGGWRAT